MQPLTGVAAYGGKTSLVGVQMAVDRINKSGGIKGRPVELVFYDDQSNPANVPPIYTKLIDVDKVDLLIGPYATNMVAPSIPVLRSVLSIRPVDQSRPTVRWERVSGGSGGTRWCARRRCSPSPCR